MKKESLDKIKEPIYLNIAYGGTMYFTSHKTTKSFGVGWSEVPWDIKAYKPKAERYAYRAELRVYNIYSSKRYLCVTTDTYKNVLEMDGVNYSFVPVSANELVESGKCAWAYILDSKNDNIVEEIKIDSTLRDVVNLLDKYDIDHSLEVEKFNAEISSDMVASYNYVVKYTTLDDKESKYILS